MSVAAARSVRVGVSPAYDVHVGSGLLADVPSRVAQQDVALVSDDNVFGIYGHDLVAGLEHAGKRVTIVTFPAGEASKDVTTYSTALRRLAAAGLGRDSAVVALGGGVVGDLAGFVAATYLRGIAFYQVPTSLLAMVDSSVGGKTGIDLPEGKNLVGAFWQPHAVWADLNTLATLPPRELRQGAAEVLKTGLIGDQSLIGFVEEQLAPAATGVGPLPAAGAMADAVVSSVGVKATVVTADERESGVRAHLNLGHTLGHALEGATAMALPHGDAVLYGLVFATLLGRSRGLVDVVDRLAAIVHGLRPDPLPPVTLDELLPFISRDKKVLGGRPRFVLLADVERPVVVADVADSELHRAWDELEELMR